MENLASFSGDVANFNLRITPPFLLSHYGGWHRAQILSFSVIFQKKINYLRNVLCKAVCPSRASVEATWQGDPWCILALFLMQSLILWFDICIKIAICISCKDRHSATTLFTSPKRRLLQTKKIPRRYKFIWQVILIHSHAFQNCSMSSSFFMATPSFKQFQSGQYRQQSRLSIALVSNSFSSPICFTWPLSTKWQLADITKDFINKLYNFTPCITMTIQAQLVFFMFPYLDWITSVEAL